MSIVPKDRPTLSASEEEEYWKYSHRNSGFILIGRRAYFPPESVTGGPRGTYLDAIFVSDRKTCTGFNANTVPSLARIGVATLLPGLWLYTLGIHNRSKPIESQYPALVQEDKVQVQRGRRTFQEGFFGINIHRGDYGGTASEGCQTIHPDQWPEFMGLVGKMSKLYVQRVIPYLLVEPMGPAG